MENSGPLNGWTKQETLKLIEEYKKHSILYKFDHPDHLKSNKKKEALMAIVDALKFLKPNVTENSIKTKFKTLRHQLASEKKKIDNCTKTNETFDGSQYKPTLWCYDELSFLLNVNDEQPPLMTALNTTSTSSIKFKNLRIFNESQFEDLTTEDSEQFVRKKRIRQDSEIDTFQMTINKSMDIIERITAPKVISKEEAFCQYLSTELRALKFEESFDEFKMSAMILLQNVKANEKKTISKNSYVWRDKGSPVLSQAATAVAEAPVSMPIPIQYTKRIDSASSSGSVRYSRKRTRSSSLDSILDEDLSNHFDDDVVVVCDVDFPKPNFKCEPEVDL
ncbi:uncharacterized protein LOC129953915 isoform X1 [Eupeodes corollae]|uniref:uncharacterized protein LOC129953915 isoform X1 n=1 Tax=Eupeodes corollae TaxID=290404 RepID=UPI0024932CD4|nr:uncharacterized protein LOC129953915 isoform X1 [Eupeodes corollae]